MQILVLGMHRSGTSLTTRIINMMGAYVGTADVLLEANKDNGKGFWERKDVMRINGELLKNQGCNWHQVGHWNYNNASVAPETAVAMRATLADLNAHSPWVMKDPRLCLTLPCWLSLLNSPVAVIASRHPLESARSLEIRNNMPLEYGLALWEYHTVGIIRSAAALPKVFSQYNDLLANPVAETQRLCDELSEVIPSLCLPSPKDITDFITPSLKRAKASEDEELSPHHQKLYDMVCGHEPWNTAIELSIESQEVMEKSAA